MGQVSNTIDVHLEIGQKRTFAGAITWPGWCRRGRDEESALQALLDYGPRYARVLHAAQIPFQLPADVAVFAVVERLVGNTTTDFGAPDIGLSSDTRPIDAAELKRLQMLLQACWQAFDAAVGHASGKDLRTGPRGGGRDVTKIIQHVRDVDASYLASLGGKLKPSDETKSSQALAHIRQAILTTLIAAARGDVPARGPRGGIRWTPRYFVRRLAWHELDHAWEIEDRVM